MRNKCVEIIKRQNSRAEGAIAVLNQQIKLPILAEVELVMRDLLQISEILGKATIQFRFREFYRP